MTENNEWIKVYETKRMNESELINFDPFSITSKKLTNCDDYRMLKIELVHCPTNDEEQEQD